MAVRRFMYLDEKALTQYVAPSEGGSITDSQATSGRSGKAGAGLNIAGVVEANVGGDRESGNTWNMVDTPAARFDRLLLSLEGDPDWKVVADPAADFAGIRVGNLISWNCDVHIPDVSHAVARSGDGARAIDMMQRLVPIAEAAAPDDPETAVKMAQGKQALGGLAEVLAGLDVRRSIIGENDGTPWSITGSLTDEFVEVADVHDIEGQLTVVGQVAQVLEENRWHSLVMTNWLNRDQRRKLAREGPKPGNEKNFLKGPALILDLLAIYR